MSPLEFHERPVSDRVPEVVDLADYQVKVVHRCHLVDYNYKDDYLWPMRKAVVCGNAIGALIYDTGNLGASSHLNFFRVGVGGDTKWTKYKGKRGQFQDMIVFKHKFYAVHLHGLVVTVDPSSLQVSYVVGRPLSPLPSLPKYYGKLLVESSGTLFMVIQLESRVSSLRVYKLDEGQGRWMHVTNLDYRNFITSDPKCLFSISANDFPLGAWNKWNCVYFSGSRMDNDDEGGNEYNKVRVNRGLSTQYQHLYCFKHPDYQPSLAARHIL